MDSLEPSPLEWCDSQIIQWSKIHTCDLRMHSKFPWGTPLLGRSSSWATASDPRAKISWQDLAQWKCIVHQFFISLTSEKKTKYPNIILISWYPWVVSCTHPDSKAMSGSGSGCGVRSAIALPAWESQKVDMGRHVGTRNVTGWNNFQALNRSEKKNPFEARNNHQFHHSGISQPFCRYGWCHPHGYFRRVCQAWVHQERMARSKGAAAVCCKTLRNRTHNHCSLGWLEPHQDLSQCFKNHPRKSHHQVSTPSKVSQSQL